MKVKVHLWVLKFGDEYSYATTEHDLQTISLVGKVAGYCHPFYGPAKRLQAWAAKREIPYQHVVLNVPVELEI